MAMSIPHNLPASFWDVAPSLIREPYREMEQAVPVAVIGSPGGEVRFESVHPGIARVEDGVLRFGATPGATIIVAEAIRETRQRKAGGSRSWSRKKKALRRSALNAR